ncbi:hypothetical protein WJX74_004976 [Apatococcus lobatus]|uniref:SET domain-containing protein n=1 Tax=Apatococcus lobatus TaxID=904363 RepID=A0AAW1SBM5_9CHLO
MWASCSRREASPAGGSFRVATQLLPAGWLLLKEDAVACASGPGSCRNCCILLQVQDTDSPAACNRCRMVLWCSDICKKSDFLRHMQCGECWLMLQSEARAEIQDLLQEACLALRLWHASAGSTTRSLCSNEALLMSQGAPGILPEQLQVAAKWMQASIGHLDVPSWDHLQPASAPDAAMYLCQVITNSLEVMPWIAPAPALEGGRGRFSSAAVIYRHASELNHSCSPNVIYNFKHRKGQNGPQMALRSIKPVAAGEPLTISYVNVLAPVSERQGSLCARHKFNCTCERCCKELAAQPSGSGSACQSWLGGLQDGIHAASMLLFEEDDAAGAHAQALQTWCAAVAKGCPETHPMMLELSGVARSAACVCAMHQKEGHHISAAAWWAMRLSQGLQLKHDQGQQSHFDSSAHAHGMSSPAQHCRDASEFLQQLSEPHLAAIQQCSSSRNPEQQQRQQQQFIHNQQNESWDKVASATASLSEVAACQAGCSSDNELTPAVLSQAIAMCMAKANRLLQAAYGPGHEVLEMASFLPYQVHASQELAMQICQAASII